MQSWTSATAMVILLSVPVVGYHYTSRWIYISVILTALVVVVTETPDYYKLSLLF